MKRIRFKKNKTKERIEVNKHLFNLLMSNKYYYNTVEDSYMNKVGFLKIRSSILKKIRMSFLKRVKMTIFNKTLKLQSNRNCLFFSLKPLLFLVNFKIFFSLLNTTFMKSFKEELFFKKNNLLSIYKNESISFFRQKKQKSIHHNPFLNLEDNFLLLLYNFNFFVLLRKREKKKKVIGDY